MMTTKRIFEEIVMCDIPEFVKSDFIMPEDQ